MNKPILFQKWSNLIFLHWEIPKTILEPFIPSSLSIDTYNNKAWIGIIAFEMKKLRPRNLFPLPYISYFPEINLRTYVQDKYGKQGVWFFSLNTKSIISNLIANFFFNLNYRYSKTHINKSDNRYTFYIDKTPVNLTNKIIWELDDDPPKLAKKNSLEYFLTERYRLFTINKKTKGILSGAIKHSPYKLQQPKLIRYDTSLFKQNNIECPIKNPVSVLYSSGVDVSILPFEVIK